MHHAHIEGTKFTLLDWNDLDSLTRTLAEAVRDEAQEFDRIIAIANGGLTMARHFGDLLGMRKISLLQTAFYAGINEREREPTVLQPLSVDVTGERLLVFEDIVDTGATLEFITSLLLDQYDAAEVTVAALVSKSWASVQPDFCAVELDTWIIYPYEIRESIQALWNKWTTAGIEEDIIRQRLDMIGFAGEDIAAFGGVSRL